MKNRLGRILPQQGDPAVTAERGGHPWGRVQQVRQHTEAGNTGKPTG